jgi:putative SOS response-associated peptidase YedK
MCGRFALNKSAADLKRHHNAANALEYPASYNIAPSQPIVSILQRGGQREITLMKWGLVPSWAKDPAIGNAMINARAETVEEKPSFRASFKRKRCIIPASGFFEWHAKTRQPYYFSPREDIFSFAGLWDRWRSPAGSELISCAILTAGANDLMKAVHERMPVILDADAANLWLSDSQDVPLLKSVLRPYDGARMQAWQVSKEVNSPAHNYPKILEAVSA